LIQQYVYIDRLLDSSLPHALIQEYQHTSNAVDVPPTITEESSPGSTPIGGSSTALSKSQTSTSGNELSIQQGAKVIRTPKNLYKIPNAQTPPADERMPLLHEQTDGAPGSPKVDAMPDWEPEEETDIDSPIVKVAIYINFAANAILLVLKIIVTVLTSSVSVLAALVDSVLDFLSTAIVWTTTKLVSTRDDYQYPVGRTRLEPIGVLVFSVIMITSFFQVALEGFGRLHGTDHVAISLGIPAITIMATTVIVKGLCWLWCRFIKNSGVQALAQDAATDVVFNTFSIIFPLGKLLTPSFHVTAF
jgi:cation efflux family protein